MAAKFKYDDRVQIVEPQFFLRCGYPQSFEAEKAIVEDQFGCEVSALLRRCGAYPNSTWLHTRPPKAYEEIVRAITYGRLRESGSAATNERSSQKHLRIVVGSKLLS